MDPEFDYYDDEDYELKMGPIEDIRKKVKGLVDLRDHFIKQMKEGENQELYNQMIYTVNAEITRLNYILSVRFAMERLSQQLKK